MEIQNEKNQPFRNRVSFRMLLFAMCLTMNVLFCGTYHLYELLDRTTVIETQVISENIVASEGGENTTSFKASFLNKNHSYDETITKNIRPTPIIAAIPEGISLHLFLTIVFLFFFLTFFILLPDEWTLVNQKVRLDN